MKKQITCIICPVGCSITVETAGDKIKKIDGAKCDKGFEYAVSEICDPKRTIASTVKVTGGELPLVSVRVTNPIPKDKIFEVMDVIKKIELKAPVFLNQVVVYNVLGLGSDIICTNNVGRLNLR